MNLGIIRTLVEKRAGGLRKLASDIQMSEANLHRCINNNKIQAGDLEQVAIQLGVDIRTFFDDATPGHTFVAQSNGDYSTAVSGVVHDGFSAHSGDQRKNEIISNLEEKVRHLEAMVSEKERTITILLKHQQ